MALLLTFDTFDQWSDKGQVNDNDNDNDKNNDNDKYKTYEGDVKAAGLASHPNLIGAVAQPPSCTRKKEFQRKKPSNSDLGTLELSYE